MQLKVKKLRDNVVLPTRGSKQAAGIDLYACIDGVLTVDPGRTVMIDSGIACEFPEGYFGLILPRSSVGIKRHLQFANTAPVIDNDYTGEIKLAFTNVGNTAQVIEPNERLAQMILLPYVIYDIVETDTLSETERGEGGIGSTGK